LNFERRKKKSEKFRKKNAGNFGNNSKFSGQYFQIFREIFPFRTTVFAHVSDALFFALLSPQNLGAYYTRVRPVNEQIRYKQRLIKEGRKSRCNSLSVLRMVSLCSRSKPVILMGFLGLPLLMRPLCLLEGAGLADGALSGGARDGGGSESASEFVSEGTLLLGRPGSFLHIFFLGCRPRPAYTTLHSLALALKLELTQFSATFGQNLRSGKSRYAQLSGRSTHNSPKYFE